MVEQLHTAKASFSCFPQYYSFLIIFSFPETDNILCYMFLFAAMHTALYKYTSQFIFMELHEIQHVFTIHNLAHKAHTTS
jgi:hypothetical protein